MARLMTIGFEAFYGADSFPAYEYDWVFDAGGDIFQETSIQRTGAACIRLAPNAGNGPTCSFTAWGTLGANGYYVRIYMRFGALPSSTVRVMQMEDGASFAPLVSARLTSAGKLQLWNQTGTPAQIGSDSAATIAIDTWYMIELHCKTVAGSSDAAGLRLDGVEVASALGLSLSDVNVGAVRYGWIDPPGASKSVYLDDMAVNNDEGANQNSWPGEESVVYLWPTADSANPGGWVAGAGGTSNLFDAINNATPVGVAAASATNLSQIKDTAGTSDDYDATMQTYSAAGVTGQISVLQPVIVHGPSSALARTDAFRILSNPVLSEQTVASPATAIGAFGTGWKTTRGAAQYNPSVTVGTAPVMRVSRRDAAANDLHVCAMLIAVGFGPSIVKTGAGVIGP